MLSPILVRAFGRTGTTLLMQLLKSSEEIFVPNDYPFESRFLTYFARLAQQPLKDIKTSGGFLYHDGDVLDANKNMLGPLPYDIEGILDKERFQRRMLNAAWNQFSKEVAESCNKEYRFYAEKVALDIAPFINVNLPAVNNIFVTRDPRGELASIVSFNKKRGFNGFGWKDEDTLDSFARRMVESRKAYFSDVSRYKEGYKNIIVVRFEDLVTDLTSIAETIQERFEFSADVNKVVSNAKSYQFHMTSASIADSKDKWRREIPSSVSQIFEDEMADELKLFGYSVV